MAKIYEINKHMVDCAGYSYRAKSAKYLNQDAQSVRACGDNKVVLVKGAGPRLQASVRKARVN